MVRRPSGLKPAATTGAFAPPLKILAAVGAPDNDNNAAAPLDYEREFAHILDATEDLARNGAAQTRILEIGHPQQMSQALKQDAYHVLHLVCHGSPDLLELENDDGQPVTVNAREFIEELNTAARPLPMVVLNACHSGSAAPELTASFAEQLVRAGVKAVLAMQAAVTDHYASQLSLEFYTALSGRDHMLPSVALAQARQKLEATRQQEQTKGISENVPAEYAIPSLFVQHQDQPLVNFGLNKVPLTITPVSQVTSQVPQLAMDQLIGRRQEFRKAITILRDRHRPQPLVITGIGGIGKSAIASRIMQRMQEDGYGTVSRVGVFQWQALVADVAYTLASSPLPNAAALAGQMSDPTRADDFKLRDLKKVLQHYPLLIVLDDFEQNLTTDGAAFNDPALAETLDSLLQSAQAAKFLVTYRHPLPQLNTPVAELAVTPFKPADARKFIRRLPSLNALPPAELQPILSLFHSHPRSLAMLEAVVNNGEAHLPAVREKMQALLHPQVPVHSLAEAISQTQALVLRDIQLEHLYALAESQGDAPLLLQLAVFFSPITATGLCDTVNLGSENATTTLAALQAGLQRLAALTLIHYRPPMPGYTPGSPMR